MVLLSAAIIFAGLGWFSLSDSETSGDGDNSAGATVASTTTQAPAATSSAPAATSASAPPVTAAAESTPPASAPPAQPAPSAPNLAEAQRTPVRIYNNSTVDGLAASTADRLRDEGWNITDVRNYDSGLIPQSTIYYGSTPGEKQAAEKLGQEMGFPAAPRFDGIVDAPPGVIVILTGDGSN